MLTRPVRNAYVPSLDGLRAVAILLVMASHLGSERFVPGGFGVTLFFFISGYLLTGQMAGEFARTGRIDFGGFYLRRALRLMPAALAFIALVGGAFVAAGGEITPAGWLSAVFYGANYYDLYAAYDTTLPDVRHPFNILWSLAVEEHFYLVWPVTLAFLLRRGPWAATVALLVLCGAEMAWRQILFQACFAPQPGAVCGVWQGYRLYKGTDTRLDSMAWGALVALVSASPASLRFRLLIGSRRVQMMAALLLLGTFILRSPQFREVERYTVQGLALAVLVPGLIWADGALRRVFETASLVFVGRLSYALYLWHWAALSAADGLAPAGSTAWLALSLALTAVLSLACWFLIERPMLQLRRRAGSHVPVPDTRRIAEPRPLGVASQ